MTEDNGWAGVTLRIAEDGKYQSLRAVIELGEDTRVEIRIEVENNALAVSLRKRDRIDNLGSVEYGAWVRVPGDWAIQSNKPEGGYCGSGALELEKELRDYLDNQKG